MAIGRFRRFDYINGAEPLDVFFRQQRERIAQTLARQKPKPTIDPGGAYSLTIRGATPAQIALVDTPDQLLRLEGIAGLSKRDGGAFLTGS